MKYQLNHDELEIAIKFFLQARTELCSNKNIDIKFSFENEKITTDIEVTYKTKDTMAIEDYNL